MGLFSFLTTKRKVNIPQIGKLLNLKSPEGNVLGGKSIDERVGNPFEIYFNVEGDELISGQLEMYNRLLNSWSDITNKISLKIDTESKQTFHLERMLIAEPFDPNFDADLNFISKDQEFSVAIKDLEITELRFV